MAVPASFVEFHSAEVVLGAAPVDLPLTSFVEPNLLNRDFTDPNRHLIGRSVQVINKSHYKAYRGIVKEALQGDFVIVELAATMRRHRVRLCNLTLTYVGTKYTAIPISLRLVTAMVRKCDP